MKRIMIMVAFLIGLSVSAEAQNRDFAEKIRSRDTLTNTDNLSTDTAIYGPKAEVTFYVPVTKISGTVTGNVKYYYSIDGGTTYYLAETDTLTDATNVYTFTASYNPGIKWRVNVGSTGTDVISYEVWMMYRNERR